MSILRLRNENTGKLINQAGGKYLSPALLYAQNFSIKKHFNLRFAFYETFFVG